MVACFPLTRRCAALHCLLVIALVLLPLPWSAAAASISVSSFSQPVQTTGLQYQAGGHVLAFEVGRVYLASLGHALAVEFVGGAAVMPVAEGESGKAEALPTVTYRELWPGITLTYESTPGGIAKSTYQVAAGADPSRIGLRYNLPVSVQEDGSLSFRVPSGRGALSESAPIAWQQTGGERVAVAVAFTLSQEGVVGFRLGDYDPRYPLTIDPAYLWHTFYGGSDEDGAAAIALDGDGNIYVAGGSAAAWNGPDGQEPLNGFSDGILYDIVVVKLDSGGAYLWHTFYGGSDTDAANAIALDGDGNIYVAGDSAATWNGPAGQAPLHGFSGGYDIVVVKLAGNGAYQWHTFYGGSDVAFAMALDGSSNIYVAGSSRATWNGPGNEPPLNGFSGGDDIVVVKLDGNGAYQWHTFYGCVWFDGAYAIALDGDGNIYLAGHSLATWNGPAGQAPLHGFSGGYDIVVVKLAGNGAYQWHTFYGGSNVAYAMALDGDGNVYVAGSSAATWNGPGDKAPLHAFSGGDDIVVLKLNGEGAY